VSTKVVLESRIPQIVATATTRVRLAVGATVGNIERGAKVRSRVDTGQMRSGWYGEMIGEFEGEVGNPVEHTLYNEYGTEDMPAQPMLHPAVEEERVPFMTAIGSAYS